jgi:cell division protein FtsN
MSRHDHHLSRREAERLLDRPVATSSPLATALTAAGASARPGELGREDATAAAFHTARLTSSPSPRSHFVSPSRLGGRAATRAVIATSAVVALTSGGFALASSADLAALPGQASDRATESVARTPKPTERSTEPSPQAATQTSTETPTDAPAEPTQTQLETESGTATPSFRGLCNAYQAIDHSAHGTSLHSAAFTALAAEAGGADQVATYCVGLIGEPKETGKPSGLPTPTAKPTPGKPADRPTGRPSVLPTPTDKPAPGKPTDKPAPGKPTDKPAPGKGGRSSTTSGS